METNFSKETAKSKFDEYTYRIEALCNRIEEGLKKSQQKKT